MKSHRLLALLTAGAVLGSLFVTTVLVAVEYAENVPVTFMRSIRLLAIITPGVTLGMVLIVPVVLVLEKGLSRTARRRQKRQIIFPDITINGQAARLSLDTGSSFLWLHDVGARRLGLPVSPVSHLKVNSVPGLVSLSSEPARLGVGAQIFIAQIPAIKRAWYADLLFPHHEKTDGILGWREVRDNLLRFDSAGRMVSAIEELPPETAGWLKLKIHPGNVLVLETPLPEGQTGTILVDTGHPGGVGLPSVRWKEWQAAHPKAPSSKGFFSYMVGLGLAHNVEAWADEIQLGALTLTDVPVVIARGHIAASLDNFAGTLGMYALERMDLVVDRKSGFAYVRPKPPPGPPYHRIKRRGVESGPADTGTGIGGWLVAANVRVQINHLLVSRLIQVKAKPEVRWRLQ